MKQRAFFLWVVWLMLLPLLQGCGTSSGGLAVRELNRLNVVLASGVDYDEQKKQFVMTIQSLKPAKEKNKPSSPDAVYTATASGNTVMEAARNLRAFTSGTLIWFHSKVIVLGKDVLKDDHLREAIDFFARNRENRYSSWVLIAQNSAKEIITSQAGSEIAISDELLGIISNQAEYAQSATLMLRDMMNSYTSPSRTFVTSTVRKTSQGKKSFLEIRGGAVVKNGVYETDLAPEELRSLRWIRKITDVEPDSVISIPLHKETTGDEAKTAVELRIQKRKQQVEIRNDVPHVSIELQTSATLMESDTEFNLKDPKTQEKVKKELDMFVQQNIQQLLTKMQKEKKTDVFAFDQLIHRQHKEYWRTHKKEWERIYPEIPVTVTIVWNNLRYGMITQLERSGAD